jgi:hypothetical protein
MLRKVAHLLESHEFCDIMFVSLCGDAIYCKSAIDNGSNVGCGFDSIAAVNYSKSKS